MKQKKSRRRLPNVRQTGSMTCRQFGSDAKNSLP
jgi:hypothetical protein